MTQSLHDDEDGDDAAAGSRPGWVRAIAAGTMLPADSPCDVHACFAGTPQLSFCGFLVTARSNIDRLVAFCPMPPGVPTGTKSWAKAMLRHLRVAARLAATPDAARDEPEAVWLGWVGTDAPSPAPHWVYGLSCIRLGPGWDGRFGHPRPFCPALFQRMAEQPQALAWLRAWQSAATMTPTSPGPFPKPVPRAGGGDHACGNAS